MNRVLISLIGLAMFALPMSASASTSSDVDAKFSAMEARMTELEDKLESANDKLEVAADRLQSQQVVIDRVQTDVEASSGLASFLDTLEIGGWVSASYNYNLEDPDGRVLGGANSGASTSTSASNPSASPVFPLSGPVAGVASQPFHGDSNSFAFDQLWFELERPVSEENRAGFRADIVFGKTAGLLSGLSGGARSGDDLEIYQAYVQYLAPIGENGVTFKAGKFATLIGAEVVQAPYNFNITRGQVYNLFQPITHSGILASTTLGPVDLSVGLVNGTRNFPASDIDVNKNKAILWSIGGSPSESVSISLAGTHGAAQEGGGAPFSGGTSKSGDKETIYDLIINWAPSEKFESYINIDHLTNENRYFGDLEGWGAAVAGRYAISERTGISIRFEYIDLERESNNGIGPGFQFTANPNDTPLEMITLTGTVDHKLANNLTVRGELRFDSIEDAGRVRNSDKLFRDSDGRAFGSGASPGLTLSPGDEDQIVAGVEVIYTF